jgi:hypothetical protein
MIAEPDTGRPYGARDPSDANTLSLRVDGIRAMSGVGAITT